MTAKHHRGVPGNPGTSLMDSPADPHQAKPEAFFNNAQSTFLNAAQKAGIIEQDYEVAGLPLRLRCAGPTMMEVMAPALSHLKTDPAPRPALTINFWDSHSTRTPMPPPPWNQDDYGPQGLVAGYNNSRFSTVFDLWTGALSVLDRQKTTALFWTNDVRSLASSEIAAPFRLILHWWLSENQRQIVHGAAVGLSGRGLLLTGPGGSGKSTTALLCLQNGLSYAGDDYTAISLDPTPQAHSLYSSIKIGASLKQGLASVETLTKQTAFPSHWEYLRDGEKRIYFLNKWRPASIARGFPLQAIVLPQVSQEHQTRLKPASPGFCLQTLAPSSVFQLAGSNHRSFQTLGQLVRAVPGYILELGPNPGDITSVLTGLLQGDLP